MARWADKATATLTGTESIPCTQSGTDKKTSPDDIAARGKIPSINSTVTSNTITPTGTNDLLRASGLSAGLTIANPAATPADGWGLVAELKDNGTTRTLTWGSKYASRCATLPTATTAGKQHLVGLSYNATDDKYYCDFALVQP